MPTSELLGYLDRLLRYDEHDKKYCNECGKLLDDDQAHREIKKAEKIQQALAVEKPEAKPQPPPLPQPEVKQPKKPWPAEPPPATCFESYEEELARLRRESAYRQRQTEQWIRETYEEI